MARRPPPNGVPRGYLGNALHAHCTGRFGLVAVHNGGRPQDSIGLRWPGASSAHLVRRQPPPPTRPGLADVGGSASSRRGVAPQAIENTSPMFGTVRALRPRMTQPRMVLQGATAMVTRRTLRRHHTNEPRSLRITPRGCAHIAVVRHGCPRCGPMDRHPVASSKFNRGRVAARPAFKTTQTPPGW